MMDVAHILEQLKAERTQIEEAIISLERLARSRGPEPAEVKRRGRPAKQKELVASAGQASAVA
jgi:uncharacterized protein YfcZ (UPF0381/DUF406 family)